METSIASSPSIDKQKKVDPSIHHNLESEDNTMDVEKQVTDVVLTEQKSQQEVDTSTLGSYVGPSTILISTCPSYDYTKHFTTEMVFLSDEALVDWIRCIGKQHGFIIVIKGSEKCIKNRTPRMRFSCERNGKYRPFVKKVDGKEVAVKKRVRSTGTKKCEYPFELKAVKGNDGWTVSVHNGTHNHPPAVYLEGYSYVGRLSAEQTSIVVDLSVALVKPKEILTHLKVQDPENVMSIKTVYNVRQKYRVIEKAGKSQMQHLLDRLEKYHYVHWTRGNETENVTELFWSPPSAGEMLRAFPHVLMMDCTYKTNEYKFPLLQIVGVTSTEMTFCAAFAFMECEKMENYTWVLEKLRGMMDPNALPSVIVTDRELALMNAIAHVFPQATNLLCRWHIGKNVLAKCRKMFDDKMWEEFICSWGLIVLSSSVTQYEERLCVLKRNFEMVPAALEYVEKNWLVPYKERFVGAWTDKVMHFGNLTSNRAESSHSKLKNHLENSQCNFDTIWEKIHRLMLLQVTEVKASFEKSLNSVQHDFRTTLFDRLRGVVLSNAMTLVLAASHQVEWFVESKHQCECSLGHTHGLPCAHEIAPYKMANIPLPIELIYDHWKRLSLLAPRNEGSMEETLLAHFDCFYNKFLNEDQFDVKLNYVKKMQELAHPKTSTLLEPKVNAQPRGRKSTKEKNAPKEQNSTRRDPSEFEHVMASLQTPKPVKEKLRRNLKGKFPEAIRPYIESVKDVEDDGNCGFRAVSGFMKDDVHEWLMVRSDLLKELETHLHCYEQVVGGTQRAREFLHILSWYESPAPQEHWMTMPDMGHIIASAYNCVVVHLSNVQCLTFLPLQSKPLPSMKRKVITIGFVDGGHFVQVFLKKGSPMPPIAYNWKKYRLSIAKNWDAAHVAAIQKFNEIIGVGIATKEILYDNCNGLTGN
ncbi:PKS-NRPS hybrid synthetase cheA-like [Rhododendron vialii]|uniref:PKS-NRPS hybrid synthetase cheA-like n=1 Tax=Rhododendron vialii TaxID=182163 RepID=UPI00265E5883|nr:PKS-NRPS hybrid synthetase cheA-like [Rhododendron vialii]